MHLAEELELLCVDALVEVRAHLVCVDRSREVCPLCAVGNGSLRDELVTAGRLVVYFLCGFDPDVLFVERHVFLCQIIPSCYRVIKVQLTCLAFPESCFQVMID